MLKLSLGFSLLYIKIIIKYLYKLVNSLILNIFFLLKGKLITLKLISNTFKALRD